MRNALLAVLLLAAGALHAQTMYRWVDKDGKIHYGNNPPAGVAAKPIQGTANVVPSQSSASRAQPHNAHALGGDKDDAKPRIDPKKQY